MLDRVECCRLPLYIGIGSYDDFFNQYWLSDSCEERFIVELIWHRTCDRWYHSAKDMIESAIDTCTFDREHIEIVLDHTENSYVSLRISTYATDRVGLIGHTMTSHTLLDVFMKISKSFSKILHIWWMCFQQKKCEFCRSFFSYSWKEMDHINDSFECFRHDEQIDKWYDIDYRKPHHPSPITYFSYSFPSSAWPFITRNSGRSTPCIYDMTAPPITLPIDWPSAIRISRRFSWKESSRFFTWSSRTLYHFVAFWFNIQT